jgi:hypothetical protein
VETGHPAIGCHWGGPWTRSSSNPMRPCIDYRKSGLNSLIDHSSLPVGTRTRSIQAKPLEFRILHLISSFNSPLPCLPPYKSPRKKLPLRHSHYHNGQNGPRTARTVPPSTIANGLFHSRSFRQSHCQFNPLSTFESFLTSSIKTNVYYRVIVRPRQPITQILPFKESRERLRPKALAGEEGSQRETGLNYPLHRSARRCRSCRPAHLARLQWSGQPQILPSSDGRLHKWQS